MLRVLHLFDRSADYQTTSAIHALSADTSGTMQVIKRTIGRGGDFGLPFFAVAALRRAQSLDFDILHAWGPAALRVATFATRSPVVYSPKSDPHRTEVGWLRSAVANRNIQVICPTDTVRRALVERGVPMERCHLIRPGVSFASTRRKRNEQLRAELGLSNDDRVTLTPGEATRQSCHEDALYAMTLLNCIDRRNRMLVWGRGPHAHAVRRFAVKLKQPTLIDAEHKLGRPIEFDELFGVADEILVTALRPVPTFPICQCMAAGLPIVATVTPTIAELLEDRHTALLVGKHTPRVIAQRILDLRTDSQLQWSIADMARTEAYEFFSLSRFLEQHRSVYQQITEGKPVEVAQSAPGAGLRFHGRG